MGFTPTDALLVLMVLVWGLNYILLKAVLEVVTPFAFNKVSWPACTFPHFQGRTSREQ